MANRKVNITISDELVQYYQELSEEMGIPRSAAMVMAMKTYMDQQKSLRLGDIYKSMEEMMQYFKEQEELKNNLES